MLVAEALNLLYFRMKNYYISFFQSEQRLLNEMVCDVVWDEIEMDQDQYNRL
jgi:hypothetical protein